MPKDESNSTYPAESENEESKESTAGTSFSLDITARGRPLIIFKGYEHRQVRVDRARNLKAYRCIKKKCKGRLHTDYNDTNVRIVSDHVHEPNFDAEFKRRRRTLLRELAQKGNVSPSQIIQKARDLEMQYRDVCESTKTSYAAERRYIQRYWNRQKQQEFSNGNGLLPIKQQIVNHSVQLKMEQEDNDDKGTGEESFDGSSLFPGDSVKVSEQCNQFLQMTGDGASSGNNASALNVYLNLLLQQMLSNAVGSSTNSSLQETDGYSSTSLYQEQISSLAIKQTFVDAEIQTINDESGIRGPADDAAVRDTLALELGTILAKKFWPAHYLREDKLKLMVDVISKLLGCC
uniref:FLYWCH-type domain-containing protein n=1 Tax=Setaria digitata TaxID=48799 RepID=A0A915Q7J0_9BILA